MLPSGPIRRLLQVNSWLLSCRDWSNSLKFRLLDAKSRAGLIPAWLFYVGYAELLAEIIRRVAIFPLDVAPHAWCLRC